MFRKVVYCSGRLYAVQEGYMDVQEGYMMKKIMMIFVAMNGVASQPHERQPSGRPYDSWLFEDSFCALKFSCFILYISISKTQRISL